MIVEHKGQNVKIIPYKLGGAVAGTLTLLPGNNEVDEKLWNSARQEVKHQLGKQIVEVAVTVKKEKVKVPDTEVGGKPKLDGKGEPIMKDGVQEVLDKVKNLKDLTVPEAVEIVENTFNLKTLADWKKKEGRDAVNAQILTQIELVEKHGEDAKKKKKN